MLLNQMASEKEANNKTVIFDMDGVILDTERAILDCWIEASEAYSISRELVVDTYVETTGTNHAQTIDIFNNAFSPILSEPECKNLWNEINVIFQKRYHDHPLPKKEGIVELLEYLKTRDFRIGLASSSTKHDIEKELRDVNLLHFFERITSGDEVRISKPNPQIYLIACEKMQVSPQKCFAIEDSYNGVRAAKAAGMRPIMVPDLKLPDDEIKQMAEAVCSDLFEVIEYFNRI